MWHLGRCAAQIAQRNATTTAMSPAHRAQFTQRLAIKRHGLTAPSVQSRVVEHDLHQLLAQRRIARLEQRTAADERRRLVELDCEAEPGLPRRLVGSELGAPRTSAGL